jgi:hypothetical protein
MKNESFPPLPLNQWEPTKKTLHLFCQIVGKIRMKLMPKQNHWWHVPLYVDTHGLATGSIPIEERRFEITFDFTNHKLNLTTSEGTRKSFPLEDGLSVASFYKQLFSTLDELGIEVEILAKPFDHESTIPFAEDEQHHAYDREYVGRYWNILKQVDRTFKTFSGRFLGKTCPVQLYWHSFDLTVTRFSGRRGPDMPDAGQVEREAYSHEVISFGFWPGDADLRDPAFYSYTYPAPEGIDQEPLQPKTAQWVQQNGSPMALLMYDEVRNADNPEQIMFDFLESSYRAGAKRAGWDIQDFKP